MSITSSSTSSATATTTVRSRLNREDWNVFCNALAEASTLLKGALHDHEDSPLHMELYKKWEKDIQKAYDVLIKL